MALAEARSELESARSEARDVTEARDEALRRRETAEAERDNLYNLINGLPRPVWWRSGDLSLLYVNDAYLSAVGLGRDALDQLLRQLAASH